MQDVEARIRALEDWKNRTEAVGTVQQKHLDERFDTIDAELKSIKSYANRLMWCVITALLAAVVDMVTGGVIPLP